MANIRLNAEQWNSFSPDIQFQIVSILKKANLLDEDHTVVADAKAPRAEDMMPGFLPNPFCESACDASAVVAAVVCDASAAIAAVDCSVLAPEAIAACLYAAELSRQACRANVRLSAIT